MAICPHAGGRRAGAESANLRGEGNIDILITVGARANIWEVKGTGVLGPFELADVPGLAELAQKEAQWYSQAYNYWYAMTGTVAGPGEPLREPAYVSVGGLGTIFVWSQPGFVGDIVYQLISAEELDFELAHNPQPYPVYVYQPDKKDLSIPQMSPAALAGVGPLIRAGLATVGVTAGGVLAVAGISSLLEGLTALLARLGVLLAGA